MFYRPSLRSIWTLIILAVICSGLYIWCETSRVKHKQPFYTEKIRSANLMERALRAYQEATAEKGVFTESYKDPRLDAIIGQQFSLITTEMGIFEAKLASANPNFAAVAVDLLGQAGVGKGDVVAVSFSGSYPGVNTAVLCACEALGVIPVTITAVGSSWWGANDPDFTWLDMETLLNKRELIHSEPVAASLGGLNDGAAGLSQIGRDLIHEAIRRNNLQTIEEKDISGSIARRFEAYNNAAGNRRYKAYLNVGDEVASLGHAENSHLIGNGYHRRLPLQNYPARGVVHLFNSNNIAVINFHDVEKLSRQYGLGGAQVPLPAIGRGQVFIAERYNLRVAGISAGIAIFLIIVLVRLDSRLFKLREAGVDPDTLM